MSQVCTKCDTLKEYSEYPKASITKSGYAGECKMCKSKRIKELRTERENILMGMFSDKCYDCGVEHSNPSFFDFYHVNKTTKKREVKQIICGSFTTLMDEVNKCVMLCPNCHRERHLKEGW